MLLSPSRADCVIFELEGVLAEMPAAAESEDAGNENREAANVKALYAGRWDKLPLPVGVVSSGSREEMERVLAAIGWEDLPASHAANGGNSLEAVCKALGCTSPLVLGATSAMRETAARNERADFVAIGREINDCPRFTSAADALRAILGVV